MIRPAEFASSKPGALAGASLLARWGGVAGFASGLPVSAQGMFDGRGISGIAASGLFMLDGAVVGALIGAVVAHRPQGLAGAASGGVLIGLLSWLVLWLTAVPVVQGITPTWSATAAVRAYRELVVDLLHGGMTGVLLHGLLSRRLSRPRPMSLSEQPIDHRG